MRSTSLGSRTSATKERIGRGSWFEGVPPQNVCPGCLYRQGCGKKLLPAFHRARTGDDLDRTVADPDIPNNDNGAVRLVLTPDPAPTTHDRHHSLNSRESIPERFVDETHLGGAVDNSSAALRGDVDVGSQGFEFLNDLGNLVAGRIWMHDNDQGSGTLVGCRRSLPFGVHRN